MPKSPTARLGLPRYEDSETASFSAQVNAISEAVDAKVALRKEGASLVAAHTGSGTVEPGEHVLAQTNASTWTLPAAEAGVECAVSCPTGIESVTVKAGGTAKIYGDFLEGVASCTLLPGQHITLRSDGTNWYIIAGEPKPTATWSGLVPRATGTLYTPSATRTTKVLLVGFNSSAWNATFGTGVVTLGTFSGGANQQNSVCFELNPGQRWVVATGAVSLLESNYLIQ